MGRRSLKVLSMLISILHNISSHHSLDSRKALQRSLLTQFKGTQQEHLN